MLALLSFKNCPLLLSLIKYSLRAVKYYLW